ncbi:hypothetical protein N7486_010499 [Penicillium sp. IBT 16267x]|nr:hypothetical protein N7486_010499 [Penicillium sp. IBT 16267x]
MSLENLDCPESGFAARSSSSAFDVARAKLNGSLFHLPAELLFSVANFLEEERDINFLAQTNSRSYSLLNPYLYRPNSLKSRSSALLWDDSEAFAKMPNTMFPTSNPAGQPNIYFVRLSWVIGAIRLGCHPKWPAFVRGDG